MKSCALFLLASAMTVAATSTARAVVLYGPATPPPTPPLLNDAPSNVFYLSDTVGVTVTAGSEGTILDSIPAGNVAKAGFSASNATLLFTNPLMPVISNSTGYDVLFRVGITAEQHVDRNGNGNLNDDDRAGFSIIVLSDDHYGIELGFFTNRIFAQNSSFTGQGPGVNFDTTAMTDYDLHIANGQYTLKSGATTLFSGEAQNYSAGPPPYGVTNFIFMGDDTTSAAATAQISHVEIVLPVPEPASLAMLVVGGMGFLARSRRRQAH